jgi:hypothetical protein
VIKVLAKWTVFEDDDTFHDLGSWIMLFELTIYAYAFFLSRPSSVDLSNECPVTPIVVVVLYVETIE